MTMAKATEITVDVNVTIPDETMYRCLRIMEMWMDDHPKDVIMCDKEATTIGYKHHVYIKRGEEAQNGRNSI